ncbi:MAG: class I SAM-dependent methyltransferase [Candidatus Sumerlaeaceae bacterium]
MMQTVHRFSDRVENYVKYRPHYPDAAIDHLWSLGGLTGDSIIADIGSGTGISAEPLLQRGCTVYGVEPNGPMRIAAEQLLGHYSKFHSVDATAERTNLADNSVDAIICAQAFHWFDRNLARAEFQRIGKPGALVALLWNARLTSTPFLADYERLLLRHGTDYADVNHENIREEDIRAFLGDGMQCSSFSNEQHFTLEGLRGRLLSCSYVPLQGQPGHDELFGGMEKLFHEHERKGNVVFSYETRVFSAKFA